MKARIGSVLVALAASCASGSALAAGCNLVSLGSLPVTMRGLRAVVDGTVNGQPMKFIVDSGAFYTTLTYDSAERVGLNPEKLPANMPLVGLGGFEMAKVGVAHEFSLVGLPLPQRDRIEFVIRREISGGQIDGLLGQNVLSFVDTEYDLANGKIGFLKAINCGEQSLAYWSKDGAIGVLGFTPLSRDEPHMIASVVLDGHPVRAILDTGAPTSMLTLQAARKIGFKRDDPSAKSAGLFSGIGGRSREAWLGRFGELNLGGEKIRNPQVRVVDADLPANADMLLGADFFLSHRMYVAREKRKIYITFNGGHVFDLGAKDNDRGEPVANEAPANEGLPAADLLRRASARLSRGELGTALADVDAALRLEPSNTDALYLRFEIHGRQGDAAAAGRDLDQVLAADPGHFKALMARGLGRVRSGDYAVADGDLQAAFKVQPDDQSARMLAADGYFAMGRRAEGMAILDAWIAAHSDLVATSMALNGRCWERGTGNVELDQALADCNAALAKAPGSAAILDSRALVRLRLGKLDASIADYKEALHANAKAASSLYGLAIAESRKGLGADSRKHQAAALALDPKVAESYTKIGLEP